MTQLAALCKPLKIGNLQLRHRMVQGPMWTRFASAEGEVTEQMIDYYSARAKGGPAMLVIEPFAVDRRYGWPEPTLRLDIPLFQPRYSRLVDAVHLNGVPVLSEMTHCGAFAMNPVSPSGVPTILMGGVGIIRPAVLSEAEVEQTRDAFINGATKSQECGTDGVLIHGGTGYLLHQFLSTKTNKRTDKYGGSPENRMRLSLEIVRGIRKKCGPNFLIGYAIVGDELLPDGIGCEAMVPFAQALEGEGIDYLDTTVGIYETMAATDRSPGHTKYTRTGLWQVSEVFKKALKIPVGARSSDDYNPENWNKHLEAGHSDFVQVAKQSLCDPEVYKKAYEGRLDDIRGCVTCAHCEDKAIVGHGQVECALNPATGNERYYAIGPAPKKKKVMVVGGGPGGLEAARMAALRGHEVTLVEKDAELGGKLRMIWLCADQESYRAFRDWEVKQCKDAGVKIELGKAATVEMILSEKPDAAIIATGAPKRVVPDIRNISNSIVVTPEDVLTGKAKVGKDVVIIGGNRIGVDVAYTIAKKGLSGKITIIEPKDVPIIAYDMEVLNMAMMTMCLLPKMGIQALTNTRVEEISTDGVVVIEPEGKKRKIKANTIVYSAGYQPDKTLFEALRGKLGEVYFIGDCVKHRTVWNAVHEGAYAARQI